MLVVLLLLGAAAAQASVQAHAVLCGRELALAHAMYCYGIEPSPPEVVDSVQEKEVRVSSAPKIPDRLKFRARLRAASQLADANLVEACCLKPCLVSELLNHC